MTDDQAKQLEMLSRWLFEAPITGGRTRAEQIDDALAGLRAGKMGARILLWASGAVVALAAAYGTLKGGLK